MLLICRLFSFPFACVCFYSAKRGNKLGNLIGCDCLVVWCWFVLVGCRRGVGGVSACCVCGLCGMLIFQWFYSVSVLV